MIDFWAIIGKCCIDPEFHDGVLELLKDEPVKLQHWLNEPQNGFILSRVELGELRYLFSANINGTLARICERCEPTVGSSADYSKEFTAVLGLSCIDGRFRDRLRKAAKDGKLQRTLRNEPPRMPLGESPRGSGKSEVKIATELFNNRSTVMMFDEIQKVGWWFQEKVFGACRQGYSLVDVPYSHIADEPLAEALSKRGSIDGLMDRFHAPRRVAAAETVTDRTTLAAPPKSSPPDPEATDH